MAKNNPLSDVLGFVQKATTKDNKWVQSFKKSGNGSVVSKFGFGGMLAGRPKVAFPFGEGGFPEKRLRCFGKDG